MARLIVFLAAFWLGACVSTADRLRDVGQEPKLGPLQDPATALRGGQPVRFDSISPQSMRTSTAETNSLWRPGARTFFGDPRASQRGDLLTVEINIQDQASLSNSTARTRENSNSLSLNAFFGIPQLIGALFLPGGVDDAAPVDVSSSSDFSGDGDIDRSESVSLTVAAMVTDILPNGNFVITGTQEVRINHEIRALTITGVVRPEDVTARNTVAHTQIAEARISYGGRGILSDMQRPGAASETWEVVNPF